MFMRQVMYSHSVRLAAAGFLLAGLIGAGYVAVPSGIVTADSGAVAKPAPAEALGHANALSEAFRYSADHVLPAVVSIRNEVQPKVVKSDQPRRRGATSHLIE